MHKIKGKGKYIVGGAVVVITVLVLVFVTGKFGFDVLPTQNYNSGVAYSSPIMDYQTSAGCSQPITESAFALYSIPKDKYDLGLDLEKSYAKATSAYLVSIGRNSNRQVALQYVQVGNSPYALLRAWGENQAGWSYGVGIADYRELGNVASDVGGSVDGSCSVTYHLVFKSEVCSPTWSCGDYSACNYGVKSKTCQDGCGNTRSESASCDVLPPPIDGNGNNDGGIVCTQDVMQCPDGSYVGRDSNCQFISCPVPGGSGNSTCPKAAEVCQYGSNVDKVGCFESCKQRETTVNYMPIIAVIIAIILLLGVGGFYLLRRGKR